MTLTDFQKELCTTSTWKFSDLRALFVNCTLKPSPELSHTEGLMRISMAIGQLRSDRAACERGASALGHAPMVSWCL